VNSVEVLLVMMVADARASPSPPLLDHDMDDLVEAVPSPRDSQLSIDEQATHAQHFVHTAPNHQIALAAGPYIPPDTARARPSSPLFELEGIEDFVDLDEEMIPPPIDDQPHVEAVVAPHRLEAVGDASSPFPFPDRDIRTWKAELCNYRGMQATTKEQLTKLKLKEGINYKCRWDGCTNGHPLHQTLSWAVAANHFYWYCRAFWSNFRFYFPLRDAAKDMWTHREKPTTKNCPLVQARINDSRQVLPFLVAEVDDWHARQAYSQASHNQPADEHFGDPDGQQDGGFIGLPQDAFDEFDRDMAATVQEDRHVEGRPPMLALDMWNLGHRIVGINPNTIEGGLVDLQQLVLRVLGVLPHQEQPPALLDLVCDHIEIWWTWSDGAGASWEFESINTDREPLILFPPRRPNIHLCVQFNGSVDVGLGLPSGMESVQPYADVPSSLPSFTSALRLPPASSATGTPVSRMMFGFPNPTRRPEEQPDFLLADDSLPIDAECLKDGWPDETEHKLDNDRATTSSFTSLTLSTLLPKTFKAITDWTGTTVEPEFVQYYYKRALLQKWEKKKSAAEESGNQSAVAFIDEYLDKQKTELATRRPVLRPVVVGPPLHRPSRPPPPTSRREAHRVSRVRGGDQQAGIQPVQQTRAPDRLAPAPLDMDVVRSGPPRLSVVCRPADGAEKVFEMTLRESQATEVEYLPFDDLIAGLCITPTAHYTAALYPDAELQPLQAASKPYPLKLMNVVIDGRTVQAAVFKKIKVTNSLVLHLGERDASEWARVSEEKNDAGAQAVEMERAEEAIQLPPGYADAPPSPPGYEPYDNPAAALPRAAPHVASGPFTTTKSDIEDALMLLTAVEQPNPVGWLQSECPGTRRTPGVASLQTVFGHRVLPVSSAPQPYLLALSRNDAQSSEMGKAGSVVQQQGDTLWVVFPRSPTLQGSTTTLHSLMLGGNSGQVLSSVHANILSIVEQLRVVAAEYRKRHGTANPWRLLFAGHSLGGCLAQSACLQLLAESSFGELDDEQVGCITFSAPLMVSEGLARTVHEQLRWQHHFVNVSNVTDTLPQLLSSVFAYDLANAQVAGFQPLSSDACQALAILLSADDRTMTVSRKPSNEAVARAKKRLADINRQVIAGGQGAAGRFAPLGLGVYGFVEEKKDIGSVALQSSHDFLVNGPWIEMNFHRDAAVVRNMLAHASSGELPDVSKHSLPTLTDNLARLHATKGQQRALFTTLTEAPGMELPAVCLLEDLFVPELRVLHVQVRQSSALIRLSARNVKFLCPNPHLRLTWTHGQRPNEVNIVPPMGTDGSTASFRVVDDAELELRVRGRIDVALLRRLKTGQPGERSRTDLSLPTVFKVRARVAIDASNDQELSIIDGSNDDSDMQSLSEELFLGGLLRVFFEVSTIAKRWPANEQRDPQRVRAQLDTNPKMGLYKEIFGLVFNYAEADKVVDQVQEVVLAGLRVRLDNIARARRQGRERDAAEREAAASLAVETRTALMQRLLPYADRLRRQLEAPAAYELQPGFFRLLGRGAFKVIKVSAYINYALLGVVVVGGVVMLGPVGWAGGAAAMGALAADVAVDVAIIGAEAAIRHLVANQGLNLLSNPTEEITADSGSAYRAHLLMLHDTLTPPDQPDNVMLFTANDVEAAILRRIQALRPSLHAQLVASSASVCSFLRSDRDSRQELKQCVETRVFNSQDARKASLQRFTTESQVKALKFLRVMSCIHTLRASLRNDVYISIIGSKDVGKSTLIQSLFRIPTKVGALIADTTLEVNMYPLFSAAAAARLPHPAFHLLDFPGMTDQDPAVAEAFKDIKSMASLHLVLGKVVVGGATPERQILGSLDRSVPALVILNALETYNFPDNVQDDPAFYRRHIEELHSDAAARLGVAKDRVFLLYNDQLYANSANQAQRNRGQGYDGQPYLIEHNIAHLKAWLVTNIAHELHIIDSTVVRGFIDYTFRNGA
jgi:hypothetical protein